MSLLIPFILMSSCTYLPLKIARLKMEPSVENEYIESFYEELKEDNVSIENIKTKQMRTKTTLFHLANRVTGIKEFFELYTKLNAVNLAETPISIITLRQVCPERNDDNVKFSIQDFILAIHKYLKDDKKGFVHVKNMEIMVSTMRCKNIHDFNAAYKFYEKMEDVYKTLNHLTNRIIVETILNLIQKNFIDHCYKTVIRQIHYTIMSDIEATVNNYESYIDILRGLSGSLEQIITGKAIRQELHNLLNESETCTKMTDRIYKEVRTYTAEIKVSCFTDDAIALNTWVKSKFEHKIPFLNDICLKHLELKTIGSFCNPVSAKVNLDKVLVVVLNTMTQYINNNENEFEVEEFKHYPNFEKHFIDHEKRGFFTSKIENYFLNISHTRQITSLVQEIMVTTEENSSYGCSRKEYAKIYFNASINPDSCDFLFYTLNKMNVFENTGTDHSIYIDRGGKMTKPKLVDFDKQYSNNQLILSDKQRYIPTKSEVLDVYYYANDDANKVSVVKRTMNQHTNRQQGNAFEDYLNAKPKWGIVYSKERIYEKNNLELDEIPDECRDSWKNLIESKVEFPSTIYKISMVDKLIVIFKNKTASSDENEISILCNIEDLHFISTENQFFEPEKIDCDSYYIDNLSPFFLDCLNSYLRILLATEKFNKPKDIYQKPPCGIFFTEDVITNDEEFDYYESPYRLAIQGFIYTTAKGIWEEKVDLKLYGVNFLRHEEVMSKSFSPKTFCSVFGSYQNIDQNILDKICELDILKDKFPGAIRGHPAINKTVFDHEQEADIYGIIDDKDLVALIIVRSVFDEAINSSISTLPLVILNKLNNKKLSKNGKEKPSIGGLRWETHITTEISKHRAMHSFEWNSFSRYSTKLKLKTNYERLVAEARQASLSEDVDEEELAEDCSISCIDDAIKDYEPTENTVYESIRLTLCKKSIKVVVVTLKKPTGDILAQIEEFRASIIRLNN